MAAKSKSKSKAAEEKPARGKRRPKAEVEEPKRSTRRRTTSEPVDDDDRVLDSNTRRDIVGVGLIVLAIALLLCAVLPTSDGAVVTSVAGSALHNVFGVGAYQD